MDRQLTRCMECSAYVESSARHQNWHQAQEQRLRKLERLVSDFTKDPEGRPRW